VLLREQQVKPGVNLAGDVGGRKLLYDESVCVEGLLLIRETYGSVNEIFKHCRMCASRVLRQAGMTQSILFDQDRVVSQILPYAVGIDVGGSRVGSVPSQEDFVSERCDIKWALESLHSAH